MDWDVYIDSLGPEPPQPDIDPDAVKRQGKSGARQRRMMPLPLLSSPTLGILTSLTCPGSGSSRNISGRKPVSGLSVGR